MSSASSKDVPRFTPQQYLFLERKAEFKSEYDEGIIVAMSDATREHNLITGNLLSEVRNQFKGRLCEVYASEMRVWVEAASRYYYPDVVALCGTPRFQDGELDTLLNPAVVVEVLSRSTERKDRIQKFEAYRRLESFREYVLIDPRRVLVERYLRDGDNWVLTVINDLRTSLRLDLIGCEIPLVEIYARVISPDAGSDR